MAICRFGDDSDVYVFHNVHGGIECCGCRLSDASEFNARTEAAMIAHLEQHKTAGHKVPLEAFEELAHPEIR